MTWYVRLAVHFVVPEGEEREIDFVADDGMAEIFTLFRKNGGEFVKGYWDR